jgi:hypothetical protein
VVSPSLNFKILFLWSLAEGWRRLARREATVNQERQASTDSSVCAPSRKYNIRPWSTICINTHINNFRRISWESLQFSFTFIFLHYRYKYDKKHKTQAYNSDGPLRIFKFSPDLSFSEPKLFPNADDGLP